MKLKKLCVFIIACLIFMGGCTASNDGIAEMKVRASKYIELPRYEEYVIDQESLILSEDEIENIILFNLSYNEIYKEVNNRYVLLSDDIARISLAIYVDGELYFAQNDYNYFMGSNNLPEEFENNILNQQVNTKKQFVIEFPDDYWDSSVASKTAHIAVCLNAICELVELTDEEIIKAYYNCSSMSDVYSLMQRRAGEKMVFDYVINRIQEEVKILSLPPQGNEYVNEVMCRYKEEAIANEVEWGKYLAESLNTDEAILREEVKNFYIQFLLLKAIAEKEKIEYTIKDFELQVKRLAELDGISNEEVLQYYDRISICYEMMQTDLEQVLFEKLIG